MRTLQRSTERPRTLRHLGLGRQVSAPLRGVAVAGGLARPGDGAVLARRSQVPTQRRWTRRARVAREGRWMRGVLGAGAVGKRGLRAGADVAAVAAVGAGGPGGARHAGGPSGGLVRGDGPGAGADVAAMAVAVAGGPGGALDAKGLAGVAGRGGTPCGGTRVAGHSDPGAPGVAEGQKGVAAWSGEECKDMADAEPQALQVHPPIRWGWPASAMAWAVLH